MVVSTWEDVSKIARNHFMRLFRSPLAMFEDATKKVLQTICTQIPAEAQREMERPITKKELLEVAKHLAR